MPSVRGRRRPHRPRCQARAGPWPGPASRRRDSDGRGGEPFEQVPVALPPVRRRQRGVLDRRDVCPDVLAVQPDRRMPERVSAARVHVRAPCAHARTCAFGPVRVVAAEVQPLRNLVERPVQGQLGDDGPVGVMVALLPPTRRSTSVRMTAPSSSPPPSNSMLRNRSGARGAAVASGYCVALKHGAEPSIIAVQEWARTTCGYSSIAATQRSIRSARTGRRWPPT